LAEDEQVLSDQIKALLVSEGRAVDAVADGDEAHFMGSTEPYDMIILDIGLPGQDGISVLKKWRAEGIDTPVLILTARDGWSDRVDGLDAGADDYMTDLTSQEVAVLSYLVHNSGRLISRTELSEHIYAYDGDRDSNTIAVFITRLRKKLGADFIQTIRGRGYMNDAA